MNVGAKENSSSNGKPSSAVPTIDDLLEAFTWDDSSTKQPRKIHLENIEGKFIRSMSLKWFSLATKLPGRVAAVVGVAIWRKYGLVGGKYGGLTKVPAIQLSNKELRVLFNVGVKAKHRALSQLEKAGLIKLHQRGKQSVFITLVKVW
jgi:hypothetical protein